MRSTPEGARDYVVPSRVHHGKFYALPQSPQLLKQILMISGFDKYFQLARCLRDEDLRSDRQPEHTQIDMEMSFVTPDDVWAVIEGMMTHIFKTVLNVDVQTPFLRMNFADVMDRWGIDKPDLRFGMEIVDLSKTVSGSGFKVFNDTLGSGGVVKGIVLKGGANYSRKQIDDLTQKAKDLGAGGLAYHAADGQRRSNRRSRSSSVRRCAIRSLPLPKVQVGDALFIVSDKRLKMRDDPGSASLPARQGTWADEARGSSSFSG